MYDYRSSSLELGDSLKILGGQMNSYLNRVVLNIRTGTKFVHRNELIPAVSDKLAGLLENMIFLSHDHIAK